MDDTVGELSMRRELGVVLGACVVINSTIGTGIFKTPAQVARLAGSMPWTWVVWIAGGVIALCGALSLSELAAAIPRTGGLYEYLRRAYGPTVGFVFGWTKLILLIPSAVGSFAKLGAEAFESIFHLSINPRRESAIAVAIVLACACANLAGVRTSVVQQAIVTLAKYVGVALLAAVGLLVATRDGASVAIPAGAPTFHQGPSLTGCFAALVSVMWAYDGWADLSSVAGEVKQPGRTLPRALVIGTLAIMAVYLAANGGYAHTLGLDGLRRSTTGENMAAGNLMRLTLGAVGQRLFSVLILVSCVGGCMSSLLTGSRIFVPMASDGLFVRSLGVVTMRSGVPTRAVLVAASLGAFYVMVRSFEQLTDAFVVGYFPFYMLAVSAVFVLRRRERDLPRPFRVPLYPLVPLVFLVGACALLIGAVADLNRSALFALSVMLLGVPVGLLRARWLRSRAEARR